MNKTVRVPITRLRRQPDPLPLPRYMTAGAAGMDIYADLSAELSLGSLERSLIPTGFALALPDGYEAQIRPRSGLALHSGLTVLNSPGTIDADYRDEVKILVINLGRQPVRIRRGERIAQLVVAPVARVDWHEVEALAASGRGGGFGHTDR